MIETYIPLYRKYRPQSFADVVGQEAIVQTLSNAIHHQKIAHAYLFCGPRGTGKTSMARIFAKSLNCEQGPTVTPCQTCPSCTGITEGNALDVVEFDAASNNSVNDARELIENCQFSPMAGRFKVYIIDEVHMLSTAAFNALLKTLEEPPPNVIFIFATTEAHKVLPTIISRCQRFDFNRITNGQIVQRLRLIADQEGIAIDEEALTMIARQSRGGLRDATGLLDQVAVLGRGQEGKIISRTDVALFIGALEEDLLLEMGQAIAERRATDLLSRLGQLTNRGVEPAQLVKDLTTHFRNLLIVKTSMGSADAGTLDLPESYFQGLFKQAEYYATEELPQILFRLSAVERNIRHTQQAQLWLEVGLLEIAFREQIHRVEDLAQRVAQLEERLAGGTPVTPAQASAPAVQPPPRQAIPIAKAPEPRQPAPAAPVSVPAVPKAVPSPAAGETGHGVYAEICQRVASPSVKSLLRDHVFLIRQEGNTLYLGCSSEPILSMLKAKDKLIHLQKAVDGYFGQPTRLDLALQKERPKTGEEASETTPVQQPPQSVASPQSETPPAASPEVSAPLAPPAETQSTPVEATLSAESIPVAAEPPASSAVSSEGANDWDEARKHAIDLLQGRVIT